MRSEYFYTVSVDNDANEEWVEIHRGQDLDVAERAYKDYKFADGDSRLHLTRYEKTWRYEGQQTPDINPTPKTLKERFY